MRNMILLFALLCVGLLFAQQNTDSAEVKFALLNAPVYNVDLGLSTEMQRLHLTVDFTFEKSMLQKANYHSLFLNKSARIEQIFVNDKLTAPILTTNLVSEHFTPTLPDSTLLSEDSQLTCYSFNLDTIAGDEGVVSIRIKYWLPLADWSTDANGQKYVSYESSKFWLPHNIVESSLINLRMISSTRYSIGTGCVSPFTEEDGIRTSKVTITMNHGVNCFFYIYKS